MSIYMPILVYAYRCRIRGLQENGGKPYISVTKILPFFIFIVLHRYWADFDIFWCFEQVLM